jgi:hypothetical protein
MPVRQRRGRHADSVQGVIGSPPLMSQA